MSVRMGLSMLDIFIYEGNQKKSYKSNRFNKKKRNNIFIDMDVLEKKFHYVDYNVVYGKGIEQFIEFLNYVSKVNHISSSLYYKLINRFKEKEFNEWYFFKHIISPTSYSICLCKDITPSGNAINYYEADCEEGLYGITYLDGKVENEKVCSTKLIWMGEYYQGRLSSIT